MKYNIVLIRIYKIILINICLATLSGCGFSWMSSRDTNPVIQDYAGNPISNMFTKTISTFNTTASRRMAIIKEGTNDDNEITTCAEPSPDVGETFASAVSDALKLAATDPHSGVNGSLSNDYARAVATQITPLVYRTQALQLYRDAIHSQCIDRMNGWYTDTSLLSHILKLHEEPSTTTVTRPDGTIEIIPITKTITYQDGKKETIPVSKTTMDVHVNNYNEMKLYYFEKAIEALKVEVPLALEAQKEFFKNQKNTGVPIEVVKEIANVVKGAGSTTVTSTPSGTNIISTPNGVTQNTPKCDDGTAEPNYCKTKGTQPIGTPLKCADASEPKYCKSGDLPL